MSLPKQAERTYSAREIAQMLNAAPDMLAALKAARAKIDIRAAHSATVIDQIDAAIAKAEGRAP
jgi:hypothetical protein